MSALLIILAVSVVASVFMWCVLAAACQYPDAPVTDATDPDKES